MDATPATGAVRNPGQPKTAGRPDDGSLIIVRIMSAKDPPDREVVCSMRLAIRQVVPTRT